MQRLLINAVIYSREIHERLVSFYDRFAEVPAGPTLDQRNLVQRRRYYREGYKGNNTSRIITGDVLSANVRSSFFCPGERFRAELIRSAFCSKTQFAFLPYEPDGWDIPCRARRGNIQPCYAFNVAVFGARDFYSTDNSQDMRRIAG